MNKLFILGIDGGCFETIDPWIKKGYLPTFKKIRKQGICSPLESQLPPVTSPNWKCYSTGLNPGQLGIFWWVNIDIKKRKVYFPTKRVNQKKEIWDYLGEKGKKVCVINMPLTYPPKKVNGVLISGPPDSAAKNYTYPKSLQKELEQNFGYKVHSQVGMYARKPNNNDVKEIYKLIELRFKVTNFLVQKENPDFIHLSIFYINVLQHFFGLSKQTLKGWQIIDKNLGHILQKYNYELLIFSDHGTSEIDHIFNINTWLETKSYLGLKKNLLKPLQKLGITTENLMKLASFIKLDKNRIKDLIPGVLLSQIPSKEGGIDRSFKTNIVDWDQTLIIASGQGPIYLNITKDNLSKYVKIRDEIKNELECLKTPSGAKVAIRVFLKKEIYKGKYLDEAPDLVIDQNKGIHITDGVGKKNVFEKPKRWKSENKKYGFLILKGNNIEKMKIKNPKITDLLQIILSFYKIRKPKGPKLNK